jgi:hypothetical protein
MGGRLEWPDPTPDGPTPDEEQAMDAAAAEARECQRCGGSGYVLVYFCESVCECGICPGIDDCPECVGHAECNDDRPTSGDTHG